jgi:replicative DNA helicase
LLSPNECMGLCIEKFRAGSEVYYDLRHRHIYELLVEMYDHKEAIDLLTVQQRLKDRNQLEAVGGLAFLSALPDAVPSAANLTYYTDIVREKHLLRRMIQTCTGVVGHPGRFSCGTGFSETDRFGGKTGRGAAVH